MALAADFVCDIPLYWQDTLLAYISQLSAQYKDIKQQLKAEDRQSVEPAFVRDACYVAFGEDKKLHFY